MPIGRSCKARHIKICYPQTKPVSFFCVNWYLLHLSTTNHNDHIIKARRYIICRHQLFESAKLKYPRNNLFTLHSYWKVSKTSFGRLGHSYRQKSASKSVFVVPKSHQFQIQCHRRRGPFHEINPLETGSVELVLPQARGRDTRWRIRLS